jgi:hypothetical protein
MIENKKIRSIRDGMQQLVGTYLECAVTTGALPRTHTCIDVSIEYTPITYMGTCS